ALQLVLRFAVDVVPACDSVSITVSRPAGGMETLASDPVAFELDELQLQSGTGPVAEALKTGVPVLSALSGSAELGGAADRLGVASCLAHGLSLHQPTQWESLGTFTMYSVTPGAFGTEEHEVSSILAAYISVAVATAYRRDELERREAALHRALSTRDV